ncbi:MAG TPA: hypothetical protein G4O18_05425 [Dehalococcoidia bacterium]|nr:hypothetical protein [Dehalococcoidia bacterium]
MRKLFVILYALVLALALVLPAQASNLGDGWATIDDGSIKYCTGEEDHSNDPPIIRWSSLLVQIINDNGIAWEWQGGNQSGYRAAPYVLEEETIHFELDVYDANGLIDLEGMEVKITLSPGLELLCGLEFIALFPNVPLSYGHYSGDLVADSSVAQGKYDITITATDQGAGHICPIHPAGTAFYDPAIYQGTADILMKPTLSLEISGSTVVFPETTAGSRRVPANENPIGLQPLALIGTEHVPVLFSLLQSGTDMVSLYSVIPVDDIIWSLDSSPGGPPTALSSTLQTITSGVNEGQTINIYYWLNVPKPQRDGTYHGSIDYDFIAY